MRARCGSRQRKDWRLAIKRRARSSWTRASSRQRQRAATTSSCSRRAPNFPRIFGTSSPRCTRRKPPASRFTTCNVSRHEFRRPSGGGFPPVQARSFRHRLRPLVPGHRGTARTPLGAPGRTCSPKRGHVWRPARIPVYVQPEEACVKCSRTCSFNSCLETTKPIRARLESKKHCIDPQASAR